MDAFMRRSVALQRYHEGFAQWFRDFDDIKSEIQQQIAESDRVVTQMVLRAVHRAKHRSVSLATIRIDRIAEGKIAEHWSVADMSGLTQQLA
jgi:predicted ester cyclase